MKKSLFITLLLGLFSLSAVAQDSAPELVNAGNAAYSQKKYKVALEKWETYLAHPDATAENINSYTYKCASVAKKAGNIDKSREYYQKCITLNYKADISTYQIAQTYKNEDDVKYIALIEKCVTDYPNSKYYKKYFLPSLTTYYNNEAKQIFNNATTEQQAATGTGDAYKYVEMMKSTVLPLFEDAKKAFQKTLSFDADNQDATNAINNIKNQEDAFDKYQEELVAQKK